MPDYYLFTYIIITTSVFRGVPRLNENWHEMAKINVLTTLINEQTTRRLLQQCPHIIVGYSL